MSYPYGGYYPQPPMRPPMPQIQPVSVPQFQPEQPGQGAQNGLKIIPVGSITEAQAVPTDFMGDTILMPDFGHGAIYMKVLNPNTGGAIFRTFRLEPEMQANAQPEAVQLDVKAEFERITAEITEIKEKLAALEPVARTEEKKK